MEHVKRTGVAPSAQGRTAAGQDRGTVGVYQGTATSRPVILQGASVAYITDW